jgi:trehalose/maltose hydrolase-like predicted phosphorylase
MKVCPASASTGILEQHISGDVAFAVRQFWRVTQDLNWLKTVGVQIANGIATFWASRVTKNQQTGLYEILGITPPDEYAEVRLTSHFTSDDLFCGV